jgi:L-asparagine oxygenase
LKSSIKNKDGKREGIEMKIAPTPVKTFEQVSLTDQTRDALSARLSGCSNPSADVDRALVELRVVFAGLPVEQLQAMVDFGRHADTPGVMLVGNLPTDTDLPETPTDGGPSREKHTFVAECVLFGLSQLLGEPVGFTSEKNGRLVHDVVPVKKGSTTQTNESSTVFLNFHNDIVYDDTGRYDIANPDFLVLNCLRQDRGGEAVTSYADARDVCMAVDPDMLRVLREPVFRLNAPGSYVRDVAAGAPVLSDPIPVVAGPEHAPEISLSANGVRGLTTAAEDALASLQTACVSVAHQVRLGPGSALLINNRKGLHARSQFGAGHDGGDRWLQRTYIRRNLWDIRHRGSGNGRRVY